jgi:hypothetical protein
MTICDGVVWTEDSVPWIMGGLFQLRGEVSGVVSNSYSRNFLSPQPCHVRNFILFHYYFLSHFQQMTQNVYSSLHL